MATIPSVSNHAYSSIVFRGGEEPGVRYISGRLVYDEIFRNGRLLTRYWNANGQVWPEMHVARTNWRVEQPADSLRVTINGRDLSGGFTWESAGLSPDRSAYRPRRDGNGKPQPVSHAVVALRHAEAEVGVQIHTRLDGDGFVIRWLEITNHNKQAVGINAVSPLSGMLWSHRTAEHLPQGVAGPFELAYCHTFEWGREGDFWFEPITGAKTVDGGRKGRSGWGRPAFWARNRCNGQTFVCELAWGGNYEFALDHRQTAQDYAWKRNKPAEQWSELYFRMGLSGHDPVLRVLDAGETIVTPAVHMALFQDNVDAIVQATHDHVRHVVMPEQIPGRVVEIEANHRGYLCDRENVPDILKDIDVAASVGTEMYTIDAGWYGNEPNQWCNNVGDWIDGPWMAKGGGLKAVVDHAHKLGLKFGLWVEIEAAGSNSTLRKEHADWQLKRDGKPVADGRALDLTQPVVAAWCQSEIERLTTAYKLDMYRIDHNHCIAPSGNRQYQGFTEDLTWRYYDVLYGIFDRIRAKFPTLVLQNCAGGGGRLDWGTMARFHNAELSDWMRLPRGIKILNGVTMSLPPEVLMRTFGTEAGEHDLDGDVDTQLRHCLCRLIFRGIAPTLDELSPYLRGKVEHYVDLYRRYIRPIMIDGLVYHHTAFLPLTEATQWCVLEYGKKDKSQSVACIFRTSDASGEAVYMLRPRGLDVGRQYQVLLDNSGMIYQASGAELMCQGIPVRLEQPQTSELLIFEVAP